jgi:hypothetical protein
MNLSRTTPWGLSICNSLWLDCPHAGRDDRPRIRKSRGRGFYVHALDLGAAVQKIDGGGRIKYNRKAGAYRLNCDFAKFRISSELGQRFGRVQLKVKIR